MSQTGSPGPNGRVFDFGEFTDQLVGVVARSLDGLIETTVDDVAGKDAFVLRVANVLAASAASGDEDMYEEAMANLPWIAERLRVRAVNAQWDTINRVLAVVRNGAAAAINSFIPIGGVSGLLGLNGKED